MRTHGRYAFASHHGAGCLCDRWAVALLLSFLIALAVNAAFFAIAATRKTNVVTDLFYSLSFAVLAIVLPFAGGREPVQLTASLLVLIWAARLGNYLFRRILQIKVDHRFDDGDLVAAANEIAAAG